MISGNRGWGIMEFTRIKGTVTIPVADYKSLLMVYARRSKGPMAVRFIVAKPLTHSEFRRLPNALKVLIDSPDDSVAFLEWLYSLEDPRSYFPAQK
jgi:hypothetical protein